MWYFPSAGRPALARLSSALAVLWVGTALVGCGAVFGSRYNNFRAYYNTYYNASRALEDGERALAQAAVTVDRSRLVSVFPDNESAGGASGPFQEAIDKSAELLRTRPGSKWADDALLVIGKSYFYQRNLAGAEQKFRETMAAAGRAGDRRLGDEARFWLGRTYAAGDRFDEGVLALEEGLADEGGDRRWTARMRLALGELYARAGRWDEAAETLREGAPDEGDADVAGRAYVLLGQVEEHAERWDLAARAYQAALDRNPAYEISYAARLGRALVLGVDAGQTDLALDAVRRMRADDKNYQRRAELALAEARLRSAAGDDPTALGLFRSVLYDEELSATGPVRGQAHYRLAEFYRDALGDYVRASAHFDTAATSLRAPATDLRAARGAILDVTDEARTYSVLAGAARRIAESDSLLALGRLDDDAFRARIGQIEAERRRVYLDEQRRLDAARTAQLFSGEGGAPLPGQPASAADRQPADGSGGFLSYQSPASIQAGRIAFEQRWGTRPLVPNWRRRAAVQAGNIAAGRSVVGGDVQGGFGLGEGPPPLDLSMVPRTPAKREEMVTELAGLRYELANAFFLSLGRADTAAALYRSILAETPDAPIAPQARYALAEIERAAGREQEARRLYQAVAADTTALGRASRIRLGMEREGEEVGAGPVETSSAYDDARARWRAGDPLGAAHDLVVLADADPDDPTSPRAYLAAGAAYAEWAGADTLALTRPLPDSLVSPVLLAVFEALPAAAPAGPDEASGPGDGPVGDEPAPLDRQVPNRPALDDEARDDEAVLPSERDLQGARLDNGVVPVQEDDVQVRDADEEPLALRRLDAEGTAADPSTPPDQASLGPASFTLRSHFASVAARYPGTPYAERAQALAAALPAPVAAPDSPALPDPLVPPGPPAPSDSLGAPGAPLAAGGTERADSGGDPVSEPAAAGSAILRSEEPLDPAGGGFTWRVQQATLAAEADALVAVLVEAGFQAATLVNDDSGEVVVGVGRFETDEEAENARGDLPAWAQNRAVVIALDGFRLVETGTPAQDGP